jgi:hypothetical protein
MPVAGRPVRVVQIWIDHLGHYTRKYQDKQIGQLEQSGQQRTSAAMLEVACDQRPLNDELIGAPEICSHDQHTSENTRPREHCVGGQCTIQILDGCR